MKPGFILLLALWLLSCPIHGQNKAASSLLSSAIYEEEVSGNLEKAIGLYQEILKKYPDNRPVAAKALYHLGLTSEKLGRETAGEYYTRLVNTYPEQKELSQLARARLAMMASRKTDSVTRAEQSFKQGTELLKQFRYEPAMDAFLKVIDEAPESNLAEESLLWIGHCQLKLGRFEEALATLKDSKGRFPSSPTIPVTELMISQLAEILASAPKSNPVMTLDEGTLLDPATGITFSKVNTWAGRNDIILTADCITDLSLKDKSVLYKNLWIPFDNSDPIQLFQTRSPDWSNSRFSPDETAIACMTDTSLNLISISPETGRPYGNMKIIANGDFRSPGELSWSIDGKTIFITQYDKNYQTSLVSFSWKDSLSKQNIVTSPVRFIRYPQIVNNGQNILYLYRGYGNNYDYALKMRSISPDFNKTVTFKSSLLNFSRFLISPNNQWILFKKSTGATFLSRMSDLQEMEIPIPSEVGDFISWPESDHKVYFYSSSYQYQKTTKIASVSGGPALEYGKEYGGYPLSWSPYGDALFIQSYLQGENSGQKKIELVHIDLYDHKARIIEGLTAYNYFNLSPDGSKILVWKIGSPKLFILPLSIKEGKVTGEPVEVFNNFSGIIWHDPWNPVGERMVVNSRGDLWICYPDGSPPVQLTDTPTNERFPTWSPDGSLIAILTEVNQLQVLKASGGEIVYKFDEIDYWDWSVPENELVIAFQNGNLSALALANGDMRNIANWKEISHTEGLNDLSCSPDGQWIAINGYDNEYDYNCRIYLVHSKDGIYHEFAPNEPESKEYTYWSPDSKWIAFYSKSPKKTRLEGTLWEADLTEFMKKFEPGTETGLTTDFDFKIMDLPPGGVPADGTITDSRDGHVYKYKKIGDQVWMTENLAWLPAVSSSKDYSLVEKHYYVYDYEGTSVQEALSTENYAKFGVLYNWPSVLDNPCPAGWHVPDDTEWQKLEKTLGMNGSDADTTGMRLSGFVGKKLMSAEGWNDDDVFVGQSGFNAIPGGLFSHNIKFEGIISTSAYFWALTGQHERIGARMIRQADVGISRIFTSVSTVALSVRCLKDD